MAGNPASPSGHRAPDGGWGWLVVAASFTLQALTIGITYTFGVLFVDLLDYFKESESTTAWIGSIQPALLYFTGIVGSPLIKRFGWRAVTIFGSVLSAIGFATSALAPNIYVLYLTYGVLTGIGNGMMYVTSMVAVQHYFDKKRAMATGLAVSGSGVGTLVFGILTQKLLDTLGWRYTLVVEAGIILLGVVCGALFKPLPDEEKVETVPDGDVMGLYERQQATACCKCDFIDLTLFKKPIFIMFCISVICFCFGYHVPFTYTPERASKVFGVEPSQASLLVSIMGLSNVASRLVFGWIGDRSEGIRFYMAGMVLTLGGLTSILIFLFTTYPLMILYSILFGAFTGCWASLFPCILVDLLGLDYIEQSLGQSLFAGSFAFLLASPMSGWIIEGTGGNFDAPFMVVGGIQAVGGILFFFIKLVEKRSGYEPIPDDSRPIVRRRYASESFS